MLSVVGRPVDPALVETNPAVVLARQQVVRIERVERDGLFCLAAEGAVLVDADVATRSMGRAGNCRIRPFAFHRRYRGTLEWRPDEARHAHFATEGG